MARAIYDCKTPIISAVGHEPDVTISDFVADARASTPSNAAEIAVPDRMDLTRQLRDMQVRLEQSQIARLESLRRRLETLADKRCLRDHGAYIQDQRMALVHLQQRLGDLAGAQLGRKRQRFSALAASLDALSPLAVLGRGYAVARNEQGTILKSWQDVTAGDMVRVTLGEGGFSARVLEPYGKEQDDERRKADV